MKEVNELETRQKIYTIVLNQPGLNLSNIATELKISVELALYHLRYLEKNEIISSSKEGGYLRYYIKDKIGEKDKKYLSLFRQQTLLKIVLYLIKNPNSRHKDILKDFDMSHSLLSYHLKKLVKKGIIELHPWGKDKVYIVVDKKEVINFLIRYESFELFKGLADSGEISPLDRNSSCQKFLNNLYKPKNTKYWNYE